MKINKKYITVTGLFLLTLGVTLAGTSNTKIENELLKDSVYYLDDVSQDENSQEAILKGNIYRGEEVELKENNYSVLEIEYLEDILSIDHLESVQYIYDMEEVEEQHFNEVKTYIEEIEMGDQVLYLGVKNIVSEDHYSYYEELKAIADGIENVHIVYYPDLYESLEVIEETEYIGVELFDIYDLDKLESLKEYEDKKIIVNEYLIDKLIPLKNQLDNIYKLYYSLILDYDNIEAVFSPVLLGAHDPKIHETYQYFEDKSWLVDTKGSEKFTYYKPVTEIFTLDSESIEIIVNLEADEILNVRYRLNDYEMTEVYRAPYSIKYTLEEFIPGRNKIEIVAFNKDTNKEPSRKTIYIDVPMDIELKPRAQRLDISYSIDQKPIYEKAYIPVLMYHEFADKVPEEETSISVSTENFESHIKALSDEGYTAINFMDLDRYYKGEGGLPEKPIIITADDGYLSNYEIAYPILKEYNMQATYFVATQYVGIMTQKDHFTWEQAKEMEQSGIIDIQGHSHSHTPMNEMELEVVEYETDVSFGLIERHLGERDIYVVAYPEFRHNKQTQQILTDKGVAFQMTNLQEKNETQTREDIKRIHVSNDMSAQDLIDEIERLTMNK